MPVSPSAVREFAAAPVGGFERFLTAVSFAFAAATAAGGWWVRENVNELGGFVGLVLAGAVLLVASVNRLRVPDRYVVTATAVRVLRGPRELVQVSFADVYAAERVPGPYLPHRFSLDPRGLFGDAFGWNVHRCCMAVVSSCREVSG